MNKLTDNSLKIDENGNNPSINYNDTLIYQLFQHQYYKSQTITTTVGTNNCTKINSPNSSQLDDQNDNLVYGTNRAINTILIIVTDIISYPRNPIFTTLIYPKVNNNVQTCQNYDRYDIGYK